MTLTEAVPLIDIRDFPSPAPVISKVIEVAGDPQSSLDQLASVIATDPPLTTELIKIANSPFYGASSSVKTIQRAVVQLGVRTVRCIAICFAARDAARQGILSREDIADFWSDALSRGVAARALARLTDGKVDPEEAFTAGLLLDFGMLAVLRKNQDKLEKWREIRQQLPDVRQEQEQECFGITHDTISAQLLQHWKMPLSLITAVSDHHEPETMLARLAAHSERIAHLFFSSTPSITLTREALLQDFHKSEEQIDMLLHQISGDVAEAAVTLGFSVRKAPSWDEVMAQANRALVSMTLSYEETIAQLKKTLQEKERLTLELKKANERLEGLARIDPLTGLANRRAFEDHCVESMLRMTTPHHTISILLFDLDHFKKINDTYGHLGGDNVLKAVGNLLSSGTRAEDLAARLGGEELAVVLYGVNEAQGKQIAERFRAQIAAIQLIDPKGVISPTTSIGGITITGPLSHEQASDSNFLRSLLHKGDQSLYEAKQNGRNRVVWAKTEQQGFWSMFSRR